MEIPYTASVRPDTGLYNAKLGIWLFLASEVMLFGGFFSAYIFLRIGAGDSWPTHSVPIIPGLINTAVLISSSVTMVLAWISMKMRQPDQFKLWASLTLLCGLAFMGIKTYEYLHKFEAGHFPSTNNYYAIYFVMTGLHGVHVVGGMSVITYHLCSVAFKWFPGYKVYRANPEQMANRVEVVGLFWHLVDLVWIFLFPIFYLL